MSVNKVILLGRLTKDPETKAVGETSVTEISLVTNERFTTKAGEKKEESEFHNLVAWGKMGEVIAQYKKKGEELYVEGKKKTRTWEHEGKTQYKVEIVVSGFEFIGGGKADGATPAAGPDEGDLPF